MKTLALIASCLAPLALLGCHSAIRPLAAVPEAPATATALPPATTASATRPAADPNRTTRLIYRANYDRVWQESMALLVQLGYRLDRQDYRLGLLSTRPLASPDLLEAWRPDHTNPNAALENTINDQYRTVHLSIAPVEGQPGYHAIAVQVLVERTVNPQETLGGPIFVRGSGFGLSNVVLRSDYAAPGLEGSQRRLLGHDPELEKKILALLFQKI